VDERRDERTDEEALDQSRQRAVVVLVAFGGVVVVIDLAADPRLDEEPAGRGCIGRKGWPAWPLFQIAVRL
jgi:hypothetical protein